MKNVVHQVYKKCGYQDIQLQSKMINLQDRHSCLIRNFAEEKKQTAQ